MLGWLLGVIHWLFQIYFYVVFAYIIMSWIGGRDSAIGQALGRVVEPYLAPFRKVIPPIGMFDFSPIVAMFVLQFLERGVTVVIIWIARMIG